MPLNILITGAAGYIGGSLVTDFLAGNNPVIAKEHISAAVRSKEQAVLSTLGVNVLQLDLTDEKAVVESLLHHDSTTFPHPNPDRMALADCFLLSIVVHCASSIDPTLALYLITALSKQREVSKKETYFIHTSGLSAFYEKTGWPSEKIRDSGPVFELEKQLSDSYPIRKTDVAVVEHAEAQGVTSFIVVPSLVYGKGSGEWNKLSVVLPVFVQASLSQRRVYKFAENTRVSGRDRT